MNSKEDPRNEWVIRDAFATLFNKTDCDTNDIHNWLSTDGIYVDDIVPILGQAAVIEEMKKMYQTRDAASPLYPFAFTFLSSLLSIDQFPAPISRSLLKDSVSTTSTLVLENSCWWLCNMAEDYLHDSLKHNTTLLVNDTFLVKTEGVLTSVCVNTAVSSNGQVFVRGNWYSPSNFIQRETMRAAAKHGEKTLSVPQDEWIFIRPLGTSKGLVGPQESFAHAVQHARRIRR